MPDWLGKLLEPGPDTDSRAGDEPTRSSSTAAAISAYESGAWERAATLLQPLAAARPGDAQVHYRLGDALYQLERPQEALPPLERAVQLDANIAEYHYKLGNALKDLERADEALERYRRALQLEPRHARALNNAGAILEMRGGTEEAIRHYRQALLADGKLQPAHSNLAMLLHRLERYAEAVDAYRALLKVQPDSDVAWCNLGNAYLGLENLDDAVRCYERALAVDPASALAFYRLGIALLHNGKYREAEAAARRAVEIAPKHVEGWINLGDVLQAQNRFDEALAAYQRGLDLDPKRPDLLNNIGVAHKGRQSLETAYRFFERALEASPGYTLARMNLTGMQLAFGLVAESIAGYRRILETEPQHEQAARQLLMTLLYEPISAEALFAEHQAYGERFGSGKGTIPDWHGHIRSGKKLRVGYVSSDLRSHPAGYNFAPLVQYRDRSAFEVYLYSHLKRPDRMTRWFEEQADAWRSITYLSDRAAAQRIRDDEIDILVVLAGRFDENRPLLVTYRPAPVLVSLYDPATSGLKEFDYLIADRAMVPRNTPEKFTERVVCLPTAYLHAPLDEALRVTALPAARNGCITFGSFNNPAKINENVVALWARVLNSVPGSRVRLKHFDIFRIPAVRSRYVDLFRQHGIAEDRLLLSDQAVDERERHLARYGEIDIALDTFPFTGSTTTFEALSMGVPVVTLLGERMVARWSAAMLRKAGLSRLVARSESDYVEIARDLASDTEALGRLRGTLRERVARSPLCAVQARARQLERLYRRMWAIWLKNHADRG
ncbi:MAG: tetratricopeptide repeat protein [Betaproteobacteria bacterium]|nr:tetratricopeptide repeat protein [Betaproteobacteria bacterium]